MNEIVPLIPISINVLSIVLDLLNTCFLAYVWFENRKVSVPDVFQNKEIQGYIEFSFGALVYVAAQTVLIVSKSFEINLFFHRLQHVGLAVGTIAFLRLPKYVLQPKKENRIFKIVLISLLLACIPLMFTDWFIVPEKKMFGWVLEGSIGPLYWPVVGLMLGGFLFLVIKSFFIAIKRYITFKSLKANQVSFLTGSFFLLAFHVIAVFKMIFPGIFPFFDNSSSSIALTLFSLIITTMLTYRFSLTIKNLTQKQEQLLKIRDHVEKEYEDILSTIVDILEKDDLYTAGHSRRVMQISMEIAKNMDLNSLIIDKIQITGILHDIGKLGVSKLVLNKPGRLTDDEFKQIQRHSELGFDIVSTYKPMYEIATYVKSHHEKLNGEGYPEHLTDERIPEISKIISVADIYDALSSKRPYREALSKEKCLQIMEQMAENKEIDKTILSKLARIIPSLDLED